VKAINKKLIRLVDHSYRYLYISVGFVLMYTCMHLYTEIYTKVVVLFPQIFNTVLLKTRQTKDIDYCIIR
jgi:hypothetical protein